MRAGSTSRRYTDSQEVLEILVASQDTIAAAAMLVRIDLSIPLGIDARPRIGAKPKMASVSRPSAPRYRLITEVRIGLAVTPALLNNENRYFI